MRGFVLLKPEAIQRNLVGKIVCFIEDKGLKIIGLKMITATEDQIRQLYGEHQTSSHYDNLINLCANGPVVAIAIESPLGIDSAELLKDLQGKHDVSGTIRFYFSSHPSRGVLHCSSSGEGVRESSIFFNESEINNYRKVLDEWIVSNHTTASSFDSSKPRNSEPLMSRGMDGRKVDLLFNQLSM
ncbi:nucleoside-diphosphate kinase [Rossellomorea sp. NS-SX7]|uniref:nucleoside-diphosphate kinase n=1 Tax=Rossellomorea sp. NS-SX7 TaxID=3463856 RepID=UPI0040596FE8